MQNVAQLPKSFRRVLQIYEILYYFCNSSGFNFKNAGIYDYQDEEGIRHNFHICHNFLVVNRFVCPGQ